MSGIWRSARKFIYQRLLHADDSPHRIALGVAIGLFIGFSPTMGLQMVIAIALAALLRANKAACVPMVWVTNPFTFVPIYGFCWWLGSLMLGGTAASRADALERLQQGGQGLFAGFFSYDYWAHMVRLMAELGVELWVGCLAVGLVVAVIGYFATRWTVTAYRVRRHEHILRTQQRRERRREARARKMVTASDAA
ncbi:MAG TPA: DUF2062 domain-containing protein [Phycisphaerae bacterium]|mgnify:CR=1 FL=1|nr:DUF2062 domain-containing protein [Phycisphaerae bacterium]